MVPLLHSLRPSADVQLAWPHAFVRPSADAGWRGPVQARAALPEAARGTFREAQACGLQPGVRLYNLVVIAFARRGQAAEAEAFVREDMAAAGVTPDVVTW